MARYKVDMQKDKTGKYYFIREVESGAIVRLPSSYLMHKKRLRRSPNTIRRNAFAISFYLNYLEEENLKLDDIWEMRYKDQQEHFVDFLIWLKAGLHSREENTKEPFNETCNTYLKDVFQFFVFLEREDEQGRVLKVLSDVQIIVRNSIGIRRVLGRKKFQGYLKESGHIGRTIEQESIVSLLQECTNCRDQLLLFLLAETGFRIGELLGVRYTKDINYRNRML